MTRAQVAIIGGGLAGCEIAHQLSMEEISCTIFEMKPKKYSPAHKSPLLAELVCSNSLRSKEINSAVGLLKREMERLNSLVMESALLHEVPAGRSLAVDREKFSSYITQKLEANPYIRIERREITSLFDPILTPFSHTVIAAGPLISNPLARELTEIIGGKELYFYDAIAPIISADSIDWDKVFWGSRYEEDSKDYVNCPMNEEQYKKFRKELLRAEKISPKEFEEDIHFEGCLPIETMAERGEMTLAFGPLKPVGLIDPKTGERPFAVVQLRAENREKTMFNMVGFQTKLTYPEQKRVFRMIPGLEKARFERLGSIHRNTYVNAPRVLSPYLELKKRKGIFLAGQITGVEGYVESAACGIFLGLYLAKYLKGKEIPLPPRECALGALLSHLREEKKRFQPMNITFGLMPPIKRRMKRAKRREVMIERAQRAFEEWITSL